VVGGLVGHNIGRSMDEADQHCTGQTLEQAPDHHTVHWADGAHKGEYRVTPERTYQADGRYCRDYITEYQGPNGTEREKATACRNHDGAWQKMVM
jgi:surface antigen